MLASVLALALAIAGAVQSVPYVALAPGPAYNTLGQVGDTPVLTISGARTYPTTGALDLTTVSVQDHITLFQAIKGWFSSTEAVIPREIVIPPEKSEEENEKENTQLMRQSQDDATVAALHQLGLPTTVTVAEITKGSPSDGKLKVGDVITTVDGRPVKGADGLRSLIGTRKPGQSVRIGFRRGQVAGQVTLATVSSGEPQPRALIGIRPDETSSIKVEIQLKDVGGPSAGLMFALGIIDKLGPGSLTGGKKIAGTGEITADGTVGIIGGIPQKMRGAKASGATVFLVPAGNCTEAKDNKPAGLTLVRVSTLKGALGALATLRAGGTPPTC